MASYLNPVYPGYFADPFVWRFEDKYYAVGTGAMEAIGEIDEENHFLTGWKGEHGRGVFPVLWSDNFVTWHSAGRALVRPSEALGDAFWAPEVAYHDGVFYLYYSVGHHDKNHQLRVALSPRPAGPYEDAGITLLGGPDCPFAIDPHPFQDDDGSWYLFYARDFLECKGSERPGTALAVRRLETMTQLADQEHVVLRASCDWQRFMKDRPMYGQVYDWHTLEGPFVRKHEGRYYCFYSGGRWETESYGVDFATADHVLGPYRHDGPDRPRVLHSIPGKILGPGHNSVVVGPDGHTEYLAYHAWEPSRTSRRLHLDKLIWTPEGPRCVGPTWEPQPVTTKRQAATPVFSG